jgi:hypothetical protein
MKLVADSVVIAGEENHLARQHGYACQCDVRRSHLTLSPCSAPDPVKQAEVFKHYVWYAEHCMRAVTLRDR